MVAASSAYMGLQEMNAGLLVPWNFDGLVKIADTHVGKYVRNASA